MAASKGSSEGWLLPKGASKSAEQYAKEMKGVKHLVASLSNENAGLRSEVGELKEIVSELAEAVRNLKTQNESGMREILTRVNDMTKSVESSVESNQEKGNEIINTVISMSAELPRSLDPPSYRETLLKKPKNTILIKPNDKKGNIAESAKKVCEFTNGSSDTKD